MFTQVESSDKPEGQMSEAAWVLQGLGSLAIHSFDHVPHLDVRAGYHEIAGSAAHSIVVLATTLHLMHRVSEQ